MNGQQQQVVVEEPGVQSLDDEVEDQNQSGEEGLEPEPKVLIGDEEVPLSEVQNGLKLHRRFTQEREEILEERRKVDEDRQRALAEAASLEPLRVIANVLSDPNRAAQLTQVMPELGAVAEQQSRVRDAATAVENLGYRFDAWAAGSKDFEDDEKRQVGAKVMEIAKESIQRGDVNLKAISFDRIAQDLFRDKIIEREAARKAEEMRQKEERLRAGGVLPSGTAPIPAPNKDTSKMTPRQKMAYGRQQAELARRRSGSS